MATHNGIKYLRAAAALLSGDKPDLDRAEETIVQALEEVKLSRDKDQEDERQEKFGFSQKRQ